MPTAADWYDTYGPSGTGEVAHISSMYVARWVEYTGCNFETDTDWTAAMALAGGLDWLTKSDWYLPTVDQWEEICAGKAALESGGSYVYWASSESVTPGYAWTWNLTNCAPSGKYERPKTDDFYVRVARDAPITPVTTPTPVPTPVKTPTPAIQDFAYRNVTRPGTVYLWKAGESSPVAGPLTSSSSWQYILGESGTGLYGMYDDAWWSGWTDRLTRVLISFDMQASPTPTVIPTPTPNPPEPVIWSEWSSLKLRWAMDEGSGTTAYDSVGSVDGTLYNSPTWVTGVHGDAIEFDGIDQYVNSVSDFNQTTEFSFVAWFNITDHNDYPYNQNIVTTADQTADYNPTLVLRDNMQFGYYYFDTSGAVQGFYAPTLGYHTWYFAAVTYDGTTFRGYIDGEIVDSLTEIATQRTHPERVSVSEYGGDLTWMGNCSVNGWVDEVNIFDRALTGSEILQMYNNATPSPTITPTPSVTPTPTPLSVIVSGAGTTNLNGAYCPMGYYLTGGIYYDQRLAGPGQLRYGDDGILKWKIWSSGLSNYAYEAEGGIEPDFSSMSWTSLSGTDPAPITYYGNCAPTPITPTPIVTPTPTTTPSVTPTMTPMLSVTPTPAISGVSAGAIMRRRR